jgi:hypothetical protein
MFCSRICPLRGGAPDVIWNDTRPLTVDIDVGEPSILPLALS